MIHERLAIETRGGLIDATVMRTERRWSCSWSYTATSVFFRVEHAGPFASESAARAHLLGGIESSGVQVQRVTAVYSEP